MSVLVICNYLENLLQIRVHYVSPPHRRHRVLSHKDVNHNNNKLKITQSLETDVAAV